MLVLVQELIDAGVDPNICSEATGITLLHQVIDILEVSLHYISHLIFLVLPIHTDEPIIIFTGSLSVLILFPFCSVAWLTMLLRQRY